MELHIKIIINRYRGECHNKFYELRAIFSYEMFFVSVNTICLSIISINNFPLLHISFFSFYLTEKFSFSKNTWWFFCFVFPYIAFFFIFYFELKFPPIFFSINTSFATGEKETKELSLCIINYSRKKSHSWIVEGKLCCTWSSSAEDEK